MFHNAAVIEVQRHMESAPYVGQCRDMHVHGYAILKLLPRSNHAQSLYCGGENEQCGKRDHFKRTSSVAEQVTVHKKCHTERVVQGQYTS